MKANCVCENGYCFHEFMCKTTVSLSNTIFIFISFPGFFYFFHGKRQYKFDPHTKRILTILNINSWFNCRNKWGLTLPKEKRKSNTPHELRGGAFLQRLTFTSRQRGDGDAWVPSCLSSAWPQPAFLRRPGLLDSHYLASIKGVLRS